MSHTPGPWAIEKDSKDIVKVRAYATVATCTTAGLWDSKRTQVISPEECMANARLIAAAPELLEVLEEYHKLSASDGWYADKVKAAIAKAKGGA
jgi:hypothetical protein